MHASNVADFFVKSIEMEDSYKKTFNLGGPDTFSWKEIIHIIALASNKLTWKIPAPVLPVKILASILEGFEWFPVTKDQLTMLMEGNIVSEQYFNEFDCTSGSRAGGQIDRNAPSRTKLISKKDVDFIKYCQELQNKYKITIKRGCSEYYKVFPEYRNIYNDENKILNV